MTKDFNKFRKKNAFHWLTFVKFSQLQSAWANLFLAFWNGAELLLYPSFLCQRLYILKQYVLTFFKVNKSRSILRKIEMSPGIYNILYLVSEGISYSL